MQQLAGDRVNFRYLGRLCENAPVLANRCTISRELEREGQMGRFIEGADRTQMTLLPEAVDDYVGEDTRFAWSMPSSMRST